MSSSSEIDSASMLKFPEQVLKRYLGTCSKAEQHKREIRNRIKLEGNVFDRLKEGLAQLRQPIEFPE